MQLVRPLAVLAVLGVLGCVAGTARAGLGDLVLPKWEVTAIPAVQDCGYSRTMESHARLDPQSDLDYDLDLRTWVNDPLYYELDYFLRIYTGQRPADRCADFDAWYALGKAAVVDIACLPESWLHDDDVCDAYRAHPARARRAMVEYFAAASRQCPDSEPSLEFGRHDIGLELKDVTLLDFLDLSVSVELDDFVVNHMSTVNGLVAWPDFAWEWFLQKSGSTGCNVPPVDCNDVFSAEDTPWAWADAERLADVAFRRLLGFIVAEGQGPICAPLDVPREVDVDVHLVPGSPYFVMGFGPLSACELQDRPIGDPICELMGLCVGPCPDGLCTCLDGSCVCDDSMLATPVCDTPIIKANTFKILWDLIRREDAGFCVTSPTTAAEACSPYLYDVTRLCIAAEAFHLHDCPLDAPVADFDAVLEAVANLVRMAI